MAAGGTGQRILNGIILVCAVLGLIAWYSNFVKMGKKLAINDLEAVHYSGTATEAEAKAVGEALKTYGFFDHSKEKDVLLNKSKDGTKVQFVLVDGKWDEADVVTEFETGLASAIAPAVGGVPFTIVLGDDKLNEKKALKIQRVQQTYSHTAQEKVKYYEPVTLEQATTVGKALQEATYFDGTAPADVVLETKDNILHVGFIVVEGKWNEEPVLQYYADIAKKVTGALGGEPPVVELMNTAREVKKTMTAPAN